MRKFRFSSLLISFLLITEALAITLVVRAHLKDSSLAHLQQSGFIRIGYAVEAPYSYLLADGTVTGESPEIARYVVNKLGIRKIEWKLMEFGLLIPELEAHKIDVIASGMFINSDRARQIAFSNPTFHVREGLLVAKGNPRNITSYQQVLTDPGIRIAVISGSVEESMFRQAGFDADKLIPVPDALTGKIAVETNVAEGLALSTPTLQWMVLQEKTGKTEALTNLPQTIFKDSCKNGYGGFGFRKDENQLINAWNDILKSYIGTREHVHLVSKFGFTTAELPGEIRTNEILQP